MQAAPVRGQAADSGLSLIAGMVTSIPSETKMNILARLERHMLSFLSKNWLPKCTFPIDDSSKHCICFINPINQRFQFYTVSRLEYQFPLQVTSYAVAVIDVSDVRVRIIRISVRRKLEGLKI